MTLNPIVFTEKVVRSFLRYQLTAYPFADARLPAPMRRLLLLDKMCRTPLLKGPYISLSRPFRQGAKAVVNYFQKEKGLSYNSMKEAAMSLYRFFLSATL